MPCGGSVKTNPENSLDDLEETMCTAIFDGNLFGRTLDFECGFGEKVVAMPRGYRFPFPGGYSPTRRYALLGTALSIEGVPLYFDAVNEVGLAMAGLHFPGYAVYRPGGEGKYDIPSFALIPWILGQCGTVKEAAALLEKTNVTDDAFSPDLPTTPLHWMIAGRQRAVTVEAVKEGVMIYENRFGVMTNNPPFPYHETHLADYLGLDAATPENRLCAAQPITPYSRGLGGMGLPGDYSSASRFVRAVFVKSHTAGERTVDGAIGRFFHLAETVSVPRGCVRAENGREVFTVYTSCADLARPAYYFTTYACRRIACVSLRAVDTDADTLAVFPMRVREDILEMNR